MNSPAALPTSGTGRSRALVLALAFGPPIGFATARVWLKWEEGRHAQNPAFAISPLPAAGSVEALFLPGVLAVAAVLLVVAVLWLWWRRGGARAVQRVLLALWALLWLGGAGAVVVAHANTAQLVPLPPEAARVLGLRPRMPTLRQLGGSEVILEFANQAGPLRVTIGDERAAHWAPGQRVRASLAHGRFYGLYLTGWEILEPAPAAQ